MHAALRIGTLYFRLLPAVALPVTLFLQSAFEIANDNEAPEVRASIAYAHLAFA
jgi:hypothetical protein